MPGLPKDCAARVISAEARKLVHYRFPSEHWEYHEETGRDVGRDCSIELVESDEFVNKKIEGQIKGTRSPNRLKGKDVFSFAMEKKTINYGLSSPIAFVLFYVDVDHGIVYYLPIQDYFIANPELFDALESNTTTINVHIPIDNIVSNEDFDLRQIAKSIYVCLLYTSPSPRD